MSMAWWFGGAAAVAVSIWSSTAGFADKVTLRDGTEKEGTVLMHDSREVRLRINEDGLTMTVVLPASQVAEIVLNSGTGAKNDGVGAASQPVVKKNVPRPQVKRAPGDFFYEMALLGMGQGAARFDTNTLPGDQQTLWNKAVEAETNKDAATVLGTLTKLATLDGVDARTLNKLAMRRHRLLFGHWLAEVRWEALQKTHGGVFDLKEVTEIEKPDLSLLMRAATPVALEPIKQYFPVPAAQAVPGEKATTPLAGITASNTLAVKPKALFASAVLNGQLTLEPQMPEIDRMLLRQQLSAVQAVIGKCLELEPIARRDAEKAKADADRARRESERPHVNTPPPVSGGTSTGGVFGGY